MRHAAHGLVRLAQKDHRIDQLIKRYQPVKKPARHVGHAAAGRSASMSAMLLGMGRLPAATCAKIL